MEVPVAVRCRIPEHLKKIGKNQDWLADRLGRSKSQISDYVSMRFTPRVNILKRIAEILNVYIDDLYEWEWREE